MGPHRVRHYLSDSAAAAAAARGNMAGIDGFLVQLKLQDSGLLPSKIEHGNLFPLHSSILDSQISSFCVLVQSSQLSVRRSILSGSNL